MAIAEGAARYNTPVKYGKTLTLTMSDGTTKQITGTQAQRIQKYLEDNPRFIYFITNEDTGEIEFYALNDSGCGFCKVAVMAPTAEATDPIDCEDGLPNCPDDELNPTTPSLVLSTYHVQVEVGKDATVTAYFVPEDDTVTWESKDTGTATVTDGKITGVKEGDTTITVKTSSNKEATISVKVLAEGSQVNSVTGGSTALK